MSITIWQQCLARLSNELPISEFRMWILPLQAELNNNILALYAPNRFVLNFVKKKYLNSINELLNDFCGKKAPLLLFKIGRKSSNMTILRTISHCDREVSPQKLITNIKQNYIKNNILSINQARFGISNINSKQNFVNFVEGKSNQLARAVALHVSNNPGNIYNPLFIYSDTGLGKTHLLHAIGNFILAHKDNAKVAYLSSERFVYNMVKALQKNTIDEFKIYYRSIHTLLIDDVQFFAKKFRSQEELFHILNVLLENNHQIILTSEYPPKKMKGVYDRLKSRFSCGLTVAIEPPDLETRILILKKKAEEYAICLPDDVILFIAKYIHTNISELEGALNIIIANHNFTKEEITVDLVYKSLRNLITLHKKIITIDNIQKTVAKYYKINVSDLISKRRSISINRYRQIAMTLSKELTNHSLSEIGDIFGRRNHATVLHACRKINHMRDNNYDVNEDFYKLINILSS